jgi:WD40 repeat protein
MLMSMMINALLWIVTLLTMVSAPIQNICTGIGLQPRPAEFSPQGIILTTWDRQTMWAYDIVRNTRYPIDNSTPCGTNCHLSPDARSITYRDNIQGAMGAMWLNGGNRRVLVTSSATEVEWWPDGRLLVWTERNRPYILSPETQEIESLSARGLISVQPMGEWGVAITANDDHEFIRYLVHTQGDGQSVLLGLDEAYFSASAWSPDGRYLAFVGHSEHDDAFRRGGEIFLIQPADATPTRMTDFTSAYGAVRQVG